MARKPQTKKRPRAAKRLRPGELDNLVLTYMAKHKAEAPLSASAIANGIGRSGGAVSNCLLRLAKDKKVRLARRRPRGFALEEAR